MPKAFAAIIALTLPDVDKAAPEAIHPDFAVIRGCQAHYEELMP